MLSHAHIQRYLDLLPPDLKSPAMEFYRSLNQELRPKTKLEYCRVFVQLRQATKAAPVVIRSKGRWLQARAVRQAMIRGGFIEPQTPLWGLSDTWRRHDGSRASQIRERLIYPDRFQQILAAAPRVQRRKDGTAPWPPHGAQFRFACVLAYYAGMRRTEIVQLRPEQICELPTGHFQIHISGVTTKNQEAHDTYLPQWFQGNVEEFRQWGGFSIDEAYVSETFWYIARHKLKLKTTFHALRHSAATLTWKGLAGKEKQTMLGHKNYTTTQIYDHVEQEMPPGLLARWNTPPLS
jgi:integrase